MRPFVDILDRSLRKINSVVYRPFSMMGISQSSWDMYSDTEGSSDSWYSVNVTFENQTELQWKPPPYLEMGGWEKKKHFREMNFFGNLPSQNSVLGRAAFAVWCANQLTHGDSEFLNKIHYLTVFYHWTESQAPNLELGWFEPAKQPQTIRSRTTMRLVPVHHLHDSSSDCAEWVSTEDDDYCDVNWVICPQSCPNTGDIPEYNGYLWKRIPSSDYDYDYDETNKPPENEIANDNKGIVRLRVNVGIGRSGNTTSRGGRRKATKNKIIRYRRRRDEEQLDVGVSVSAMAPQGTAQLQNLEKIKLSFFLAALFFYLLFRYVKRSAKPSNKIC